MSLRVFALFFAALWVVAAAVQYNDPDWLPWVGVYLAAAAVSAWGAFRSGIVVQSLSRVVAVICLVWAFRLWPQAKATPWQWNEVQRETGGLLLAGFWLLVLAGSLRWRARQKA